jgi:hypothetical protein
VVRKQPEGWGELPNREKLSVQVEEDMDRLFKVEEWKLSGFDSMFVCLGSRRKHGE